MLVCSYECVRKEKMLSSDDEGGFQLIMVLSLLRAGIGMPLVHGVSQGEVEGLMGKACVSETCTPTPPLSAASSAPPTVLPGCDSWGNTKIQARYQEL